MAQRETPCNGRRLVIGCDGSANHTEADFQGQQHPFFPFLNITDGFYSCENHDDLFRGAACVLHTPLQWYTFPHRRCTSDLLPVQIPRFLVNLEGHAEK